MKVNTKMYRLYSSAQARLYIEGSALKNILQITHRNTATILKIDWVCRVNYAFFIPFSLLMLHRILFYAKLSAVVLAWHKVGYRRPHSVSQSKIPTSNIKSYCYLSLRQPAIQYLLFWLETKPSFRLYPYGPRHSKGLR